VLIPPEDLGPKGDLNDWLRVGAKGDLAAFRSILERALAVSPTPWVVQIQRLPPDLAPWDLEDHPGVRDLLCELGHQGVLSRDAHLRLLAERYGVALTTLQEAAQELAQERGCRTIANTPLAGLIRAGRLSCLMPARGSSDTLSVLVSRLREIGACGLYRIGGWQPASLPLFRRADWMYIEIDRDATDRTTQPAWCWRLPSNNTRAAHRPDSIPTNSSRRSEG
jgi:hypothetical protein